MIKKRKTETRGSLRYEDEEEEETKEMRENRMKGVEEKT